MSIPSRAPEQQCKIQTPRMRQALIFASAGWPVFPIHSIDWNGHCTCGNAQCSRPGKHPRTSNGLHDATLDADKIVAHWKLDKSSNVGVKTGNGLFVIDVDGVAGEASLRRLQGDYDTLPATLTIKTGRGRHLYFHANGFKLPNSAGKLGVGIDVRGDGAYVIGPTSRHSSGTIYGPVRNGRRRPAAAPRWLIEEVIHGDKGWAQPETIAGQHKTGRTARYGAAALESELGRLAEAPRGQRNNTLNQAAFKLAQLAGEGSLDLKEIVTALTQKARAIGLHDDEIASTIQSGLKSGLLKPRLLKDISSPKQYEQTDPLTSELAELGQTDADNVTRFTRRFGDKIMCTPGHGFLVYDGTRWMNDRLLEHIKLAEETARQIAKEASHLQRDADRAARTRFAEQSCSKGALDRMCSLAKSRMMVEDSKFDVAPWSLNTLSGTINLRTGDLKPHDPNDLLTKLTPFDFDPHAKCTQFSAFLAKALGHDQKLMDYVQKAVGYSITGSTREQVLFLAQGPTKTGKSTFLNLMRELVGDYGVHTPSETLLAKQYDNSIPADIARLAGARMVTAIEVNWSRQIDEAKIKSMTGGDAMTARHLYRDFFQFTPEFKLWFAVNDFPKARGTDGAFWERVRVIPFKV